MNNLVVLKHLGKITILKFLERANEMHHHSPHLEVIPRLNAEHGEVLVGRTQFDIPLTLMREVKVFHRELTIPECHDNRTVMSLNSPVDYHLVAIKYASILHRVARDIAIE